MRKESLKLGTLSIFPVVSRTEAVLLKVRHGFSPSKAPQGPEIYLRIIKPLQEQKKLRINIRVRCPGIEYKTVERRVKDAVL